MRRFLGCGLIAAFTILPTAIRVSAEPPPSEPVIVANETVTSVDCTDRCFQATK
jgi:hypothetical protein